MGATGQSDIHLLSYGLWMPRDDDDDEDGDGDEDDEMLKTVYRKLRRIGWGRVFIPASLVSR